MSHRCPKCQHLAPADDPQHRRGVCPACGLVYHKFQQYQTRRAELDLAEEDREPWLTRLWAALGYVPAVVDPIAFWGRVAAWVALLLWCGYFASGGVDWQRIGGSFLHNVNLAFHEFGHVAFAPFGRTLMILGGSLFQVLLPLGLLLAFVFYRQDTFGGSVMLWWSGQNLVDVAPYIADAQDRALPLILGMGEEAHDWGNLLTHWQCLDQAKVFASWSFNSGVLVMALALIWGAWLLWQQKQVLDPNHIEH